MKIDVNTPVLSQLTGDKSVKQTQSNTLAATPGTTEDRITFRSDSVSIQALTSQAMQSPAIRQEKVAALTQSVNNGTYKPDAKATASAILESETV